MNCHHDGCGCEDCTLAGLQEASDEKLQCATVPVGVTIFAELSHTGQERQTVKPLDACIANLVRELNRAGVETRGSCCGHGGQGEIILGDGYVLKVKPLVHVEASKVPTWQEIAKTLAIAYGTLREFRPLAHTEQQDSDACDEDCERCAFDSAMTRIDDVLGKVCEANGGEEDEQL